MKGWDWEQNEVEMKVIVNQIEWDAKEEHPWETLVVDLKLTWTWRISRSLTANLEEEFKMSCKDVWNRFKLVWLISRVVEIYWVDWYYSDEGFCDEVKCSKAY